MYNEINLFTPYQCCTYYFPHLYAFVVAANHQATSFWSVWTIPPIWPSSWSSQNLKHQHEDSSRYHPTQCVIIHHIPGILSTLNFFMDRTILVNEPFSLFFYIILIQPESNFWPIIILTVLYQETLVLFIIWEIIRVFNIISTLVFTIQNV